MRKIYCDFCREEITTVYHEINVDNLNFEVCNECHTRFIDKLRRLLSDTRRHSRK